MKLTSDVVDKRLSWSGAALGFVGTSLLSTSGDSIQVFILYSVSNALLLAYTHRTKQLPLFLMNIAYSLTSVVGILRHST